jgi:integrase
MSVKLRQWTNKNGEQRKSYDVDVTFQHPDGQITRVRKRSPVNTLRGAERYEHEILQALLDGSYGKVVVPVQEVPTLAEFASRFLEHAQVNNKHSTARSKGHVVQKHLIPEFGHRQLDKIGLADIEAFKARLLKQLTKKSVNNVLGVLHRLFNLALEYEVIKAAPKTRWLKAPKPDFDFLSAQEAQQLIARAEPGRWQTMIIVALHTGLRIGELVALAWDCVDLNAGRLVVKRAVYKGHLDTPKGGRTREVPLNATVVQTLRTYPRRLGCNWVFPQKDRNFIRNPQHACVDAIVRQAERAGLRRIGWHTLRHTFASHLVMSGRSLQEVQELLGHATIDMTQRYAHLSPEAKRDAVRTLDALYARPANEVAEAKVTAIRRQ